MTEKQDGFTTDQLGRLEYLARRLATGNRDPEVFADPTAVRFYDWWTKSGLEAETMKLRDEADPPVGSLVAMQWAFIRGYQAAKKPQWGEG